MVRRYFKKCRVMHPDKNQGDPNAAAKFVVLKEAYETLSDEKKRRIYDSCVRPSTVLARSRSRYPRRRPPSPPRPC